MCLSVRLTMRMTAGSLNRAFLECHKYFHIIIASTFKDFLRVQFVQVMHRFKRWCYISTPVGKYNPDWAIAFHEGKVKHIYFVAETKGSMSTMQLRMVEEAKIHCAREHFKAISTDSVVYDVADSYAALLSKVMSWPSRNCEHGGYQHNAGRVYRARLQQFNR